MSSEKKSCSTRENVSSNRSNMFTSGEVNKRFYKVLTYRKRIFEMFYECVKFKVGL